MHREDVFNLFQIIKESRGWDYPNDVVSNIAEKLPAKLNLQDFRNKLQLKYNSKPTGENLIKLGWWVYKHSNRKPETTLKGCERCKQGLVSVPIIESLIYYNSYYPDTLCGLFLLPSTKLVCVCSSPSTIHRYFNKMREIKHSHPDVYELCYLYSYAYHVMHLGYKGPLEGYNPFKIYNCEYQDDDLLMSKNLQYVPVNPHEFPQPVQSVHEAIGIMGGSRG